MSQIAPMQMLDRYGPGTVAPAPSLAEARAYVRRLALSHYENFTVLSRFVPEELRDDIAAVYAFCRWSDDLGDETGSGPEAREKSLALLRWWREELRRCVASAQGEGEGSNHPVFVALRETIRTRELDARPFHHLIDAFEQDQRITRYETWDQVVEYCTRSADPVGRIVLGLAGRARPDRDAELLAMSDATCTALQLTNHWQDVRRDLLERDRVYLPSKDTGISAEQLLEWARRPEDAQVRVAYIRAVRPLVERTRAMFERGRSLPGRLRSCGGLAARLEPVVWLFGAGGMAVLNRIERDGCTTLWRRPVLTKGRRAWLLLRAMTHRARRAGGGNP